MKQKNRHRDYKDVQIIKKESVYKGHFKMDKYQLRYRKFDGTWSRTIEREVFERGDAVAVLLYDPLLEKVVLLEQFRIGAIREVTKKASPWLIELVAGVVEDNESVEAVALREIKEETGIDINRETKLIPICEYYVSPGGCTEKITLFCVCVDASKAEGVHGLEEEAEDIRIKVMTVKEAISAINIGEINNSLAMIALQWLQLNKDNPNVFG